MSKDIFADFIVDPIVWQIMMPRAEPCLQGWKAHEAGKDLDECPYSPSNSADAVSWRIGWNDRCARVNN
jgi:ribosome modulation factor